MTGLGRYTLTEIYNDIFKVTYAIGDKCVCVARNDSGGYNETVVHRGFLYAHKVFLGNHFTADVDYGGQIVLETIRKL